MQFASVALQTLLDHYEFDTVLDVGCGAGEHAQAFLRYGKRVAAVDIGLSPYFARKAEELTAIIGDFLTVPLDTYDCVWASHVLEHQLDAHAFLRRIHAVTREGGVVAITVPPRKPQIVGGHLSLWNAGLLLYNLAVAGFDCREASVLEYGYNISVILRKRTFDVPQLVRDKGDIARLGPWLPNGCHEGFNGDIRELNWPG